MADENSTSQADKGRFDLTERTARFGEDTIEFLRTITRDDVTGPLIRQLVRSATSVGANYEEADDASSKKEFRYRIRVCLRESRESKPWFRMIAKAAPDRRDRSRELWSEAQELTLIFAAILRSSKDGK